MNWNYGSKLEKNDFLILSLLIPPHSSSSAISLNQYFLSLTHTYMCMSVYVGLYVFILTFPFYWFFFLGLEKHSSPSYTWMQRKHSHSSFPSLWVNISRFPLSFICSPFPYCHTSLLKPELGSCTSPGSSSPENTIEEVPLVVISQATDIFLLSPKFHRTCFYHNNNLPLYCTM